MEPAFAQNSLWPEGAALLSDALLSDALEPAVLEPEVEPPSSDPLHADSRTTRAAADSVLRHAVEIRGM
jgi:hypothetical protein